MTKNKHHPHTRGERLELKEKFETKTAPAAKKPRGIRGKYKDAVKVRETEDELKTYHQ